MRPLVLIFAVILWGSTAQGAAEGPPSLTEEEPLPLFSYPWLFRSHASVGFAGGASDDGGSTLGFTSGLQLMLPANAQQSYGVGVDFVQTDDRAETRFIAAGLFIEQRTFGVLLASIGGVGYIPVDDPSPTPFGISTKLGYAPNWGLVSPFVALRSDWIFRAATQNMVSLNAGITVALE